jgi:RNA polymerase sigma-70 factor, ECF subfamily
MCPRDSPSVCTGEARPQTAAAKEVTHAVRDTRGKAGDDSLSRPRDGDAGELLRPEGEGRMLRGRGEGGVLRPEPAGVELRLPLDAPVSLVRHPRSLETETVWHEFHNHLRAYVRRRVRDAADVDDIVQKVFLEIHRGLPRLRRQERLGAWLFRAAHNAVVDHYRSPARRREVTGGSTTDLADALTGASLRDDVEESESTSAAHCLGPIVDKLRPGDRDAIEMTELRGMTQTRAAELAGISLTAMKARVQRARRRLKAALLECCEFALDARGGVIDCASRSRPDRACRDTSADQSR